MWKKEIERDIAGKQSKLGNPTPQIKIVEAIEEGSWGEAALVLKSDLNTASALTWGTDLGFLLQTIKSPAASSRDLLTSSLEEPWEQAKTRS